MSQSLILVDAAFLLDGRRRREEKKKQGEITVGKEVFPGAGPALLVCGSQLLGAIKG
jgi:hypothetical protein